MPESSARSAWVHVKNELLESVHAEQVFCSLVSEMKYMPQFQSQPALAELHKENYETSYHRNTAVGNLSRLQAGEAHDLPVLMTIECLVETARHDRLGEKALAAIRAAAPEDQVWLRAAQNWHERREYWTRRAADTLRGHVSAHLWEQGIGMAE